MNETILGKLKYTLKLLICAIVMTFSVLPGYNLLGNLILQIFVTLIVSLLSILILDLIFKIDPPIFSSSLIIMTAFWISVAVIEQIKFHIQNENTSYFWYQLFYYDRPALIYIVFFVCILYFVFKLFFKHSDANYLEGYKKFIKTTTFSFFSYYLITLIYSFFLIRKITFEKPIINLKPFDMIIFTFSRGYMDYELLFLFLGNVAIFIPLGILVSALAKKKSLLIVFPFIISLLIEVSQYLLGNGHPDIDDFILNVIGYFIGVALKRFLDCFVVKVTKGKLNSIFIF